MKPELSLPALFFVNFQKQPPSQQIFKVQCKKLAQKNISILRFHVGYLKRFYGDFKRDFIIFQ